MQAKEAPLLQEIRQQIRGAFQRGRVPHAMILEGSGAEFLAKWISAAAVCTNSKEAPCGICMGCRKAFDEIHPDIHVARGAGRARSFHVEEIRFIRSDVFKRPNEAPRKVYLLHRAQDMSREAQNALLKILEEPPQDLLFLLTCDHAKSLLPTVCSRAQIFSLPQEQIPAEQAAAEQAEQMVPQMITALLASPEWDFAVWSAPLIAEKELFYAVLDVLSSVFRDAGVFRACGKTAADRQSVVEMLDGALTLERILKLSAWTEETRQKIKQNANHALLVTVFFANLRRIRYGLR